MITRSFTNLLKHNVLYIWTSREETTFEVLKQALVQAPMLALPNFKKEFVLETDASATGVGAVLVQSDHPIAFFNKALGPKNQTLAA